MNSFYVTTPIYYVNDKPHLGHAYTNIVSDSIARVAQLSGKVVTFLTGTDEHGQKIQQSAEKHNQSPQQYVDQVTALFLNLSQELNLKNTIFAHTSSQRHIQYAQAFWQRLYDSGNIYLGKYEGWYCVRDEAFYDESELKDGLAPTGAPVEWVQEESYFFALSKWQDKLLAFYEAKPDFILPASRKNEVINFVKMGLHDLSISRTTFSWGIPVPNNSKHIMYVWLDALSSYQSYIDDKTWPADVHVIGKDILRFHAIYWPAFLMALDMPLPKHILAHGWWTNKGQKMSKSLGNVIDPFAMLNKYGVDYVRYYMMRDTSFASDANFDYTLLVNKVNSEVVNKIGNLFQRTFSFISKNFSLKLDKIDTHQAYQESLLVDIEQKAQHIVELMQNHHFNKALEQIVQLAEGANAYLEQHAPWVLIKTDVPRTQMVLYVVLELGRYIATLLQPVMPSNATRLLSMLGIDDEMVQFLSLNRAFALKTQTQFVLQGPVFKALED